MEKEDKRNESTNGVQNRLQNSARFKLWYKKEKEKPELRQVESLK